MLKALHLMFQGIESGAISFENFDPEWAPPTYKIVRILVIAFAVVVAYPYIPGSESQAFKGVSLFLGVIFSLGSSSVISNVIAGYTMTYRRAFRLGDRIAVGEVTGFVTETSLLVTRLRSLKNEEVVLPNSEILGKAVVNYSALARSQGLIVHTTVGIGYETPWRQVEAMLCLAAGRTPGLERDPPPFVLQQTLGRFLRRLRDQCLHPRCRRPGGPVHRPAPQHPRRLQRVRRADHDAGLRGRSRGAEAGAARAVAPGARATRAGADRTRLSALRRRAAGALRPGCPRPKRGRRD